MKKKSTSCKNLCVDCQHHSVSYQKGSVGDDLCSAHKLLKTESCINGETHEYPARCIDYNHRGQCKLFEPKPNLQLTKALRKYQISNPVDMFCRRTVELVLVDDLLRVIEEKKASQYLEMVYDSDDPYSGGVVVTKRAISNSINRRGDNIEAVEFTSGCYVEHRSKKECRKEKSWIKRVRCWLASQ